MQAARLVQAVILMLLLAMAASCATGKQYIATVFPNKNIPQKVPVIKDSIERRFLAFDTAGEKEAWVNDWLKKDSTVLPATDAELASLKAATVADPPVVAKYVPSGPVRNKRKRN